MTYWGLPESLDFLITRQPADALLELNRLLTKMRHVTVGALPRFESYVAVPGPGSLRRLLRPPLARPTILVWIAFFFMMGGYYFVFSWTPKLLTSSGLTAQQGINSGVLLSLGGIAGTVLFAFIARVIDVRRLTLGCLLVSAVLMGLFAINNDQFAGSLDNRIALGGCRRVRWRGFYALTPYFVRRGPAHLRHGLGDRNRPHRRDSAPLATGVLVDQHWRPVQLFLPICRHVFVGWLRTGRHGAGRWTDTDRRRNWLKAGMPATAGQRVAVSVTRWSNGSVARRTIHTVLLIEFENVRHFRLREAADRGNTPGLRHSAGSVETSADPQFPPPPPPP